ncbi:metallophosphoesterase family protein [Robbsia sp. KACC 23696]|uniref:metallophosphoesterase family protein n=1 Tax=Robbsia sp. KACC 23696 TaxID=3149231 RepID=UPI00325AED07
MTRPLTIGLISDTHGLLRAEAVAALAGVDHIIHAGDIGSQDILAQLSAIAPLSAIRGNNDDEAEWAQDLPETLECRFGACRVYVIHSDKDLSFDPAAAGIQVVVSGHSHKPQVHHHGAALFINPGSAGPRRFSLPVSVALLTLTDDGAHAEIVILDIPPSASRSRSKTPLDR